VGFGGRGFSKFQGAAEKIKRENDVHLRQLAKKSAYVIFYFLVRFWAFLGKGSSKTREKQLGLIECVSKKIHRGNIFRGGFFFPGGFLTFFSFDFFVALLKHLSVRGTQKRDTKCFAGSCV
jgi:hypothetical protein